jgi:hypothetical protein
MAQGAAPTASCHWRQNDAGVKRLGMLAGPAFSAAPSGIAEEEGVVLVAGTPARDAATLNNILESQRLDGLLILADLDDREAAALATHREGHGIRAHTMM